MRSRRAVWVAVVQAVRTVAGSNTVRIRSSAIEMFSREFA
jgi:hypothetical protein